MHDLLIVGGGAAGLAAAAYALDKQLTVRIIAERLGGKAGWQRHSTPAYPAEPSAGEEVIRLLRERLAHHANLTMHDAVTSIVKADGAFQVETAHHGHEQARTVLIATGVTPIALDVPGGDTLLDYGLGYSATTHAHDTHDTVTAVIGATVRAMHGVHELSRIAKVVYWIGPTVKELMLPLGMGLQYRHNVKVFENYRVMEVIGAERIEALIIERSGDLQRIDVNSAFVDMGLKPNSTCVKKLVGCDFNGFIQVAENGATSLPGLYAAGDVTTAFGEQLLVAIGQGARAAMSAYDYVLSHEAERSV